MPSSGPEQAEQSEQIDAEQSRIDSADKKADNTVEGREDLTALYLQKTEELQSVIGNTRDMAAHLEKTKGTDQKRLRDVCKGTEQQLLGMLKEVSGPDLVSEMEKKKELFQIRVDAFIQIVLQEKTAAISQKVEKTDNQKERDTLKQMEDSVKKENERYAEKNKEVKKAITKLGTLTQAGASTAEVDAAVKNIHDLQEQASAIKKEVQQLQSAAALLDISMTKKDVARLRKESNNDEADRLLLTLNKKYGAALAVADPSLHAEIDATINRMFAENRLSPFEKQLYWDRIQSTEKGEKKDVLKTAVSEAQDTQSKADVVDQLRAQKFVNVGQILSGDQYYQNQTVRNNIGKDVTNLVKTLHFAKVRPTAGAEVVMALTLDARAAMGKIPNGGKLVFLHHKETIRNASRVGTNRGAFVTLANSMTDASILSAHDIGYVDEAGLLHDAEGKAIQDPKDERQKVANYFRNMGRAFSTAPYKPPCDELQERGRTVAPSSLVSIRSAAGKTYDGVRLSPEASEKIKKMAPAGYTLVLKREPHTIQLSEERLVTKVRYQSKKVRSILTVDTIGVHDLQYAKINGNAVDTIDDAGKKTSNPTDVATIEKKREQDSQHVLEALDSDADIQKVTGAAGVIGESLGQLQTLLSAGEEGYRRQGFVDYMRTEAKKGLDTLSDPSLLASIDVARARLGALKQSSLGIAHGGLEKEINTRLESLDAFAKMLTSGQIVATLKSILDKSKFDTDGTLPRWLSADTIVIMLGTITAAVAATVVIVGSFGTATPFVLALGAAGGAGAGLVAGKASEKIVYEYHNNFDSEVGKDGVTYNKEPTLFQYLQGKTIIDASTGKEVPMDYTEQVLKPYLSEFTVSFVTQFATAGLVRASAMKLSAYAQKNEWLKNLAGRSPVANKIIHYLSKGEEPGGKTFEKFMSEVREEIIDEVIYEKVTGYMLQNIGIPEAGAAYLLGVLRGTKLKGNTRILTYAGGTDMAQTRIAIANQLRSAGFIQAADGSMNFTGPKGEVIQCVPEGEGGGEGEEEEKANKEIQGGNPLELAQQKNIPALKTYMKSNDVDDATRVTIAEVLLGMTFSTEHKTALLNAHNKPGTIDALTADQKTAKGLALMRNNVFNRDQAQTLLDSGLAGNRFVIPPPPPKQKRPEKVMDTPMAAAHRVDLNRNQSALQSLTQNRVKLQEEYNALSTQLRAPTLSLAEKNTLNAKRSAVARQVDAADRQIKSTEASIVKYEQRIAEANARTVLPVTPPVTPPPPSNAAPAQPKQVIPPPPTPQPVDPDALKPRTGPIPSAKPFVRSNPQVTPAVSVSPSNPSTQVPKSAPSLATQNQPPQSPTKTRNIAPPPPPKKIPVSATEEDSQTNKNPILSTQPQTAPVSMNVSQAPQVNSRPADVLENKITKDIESDLRSSANALEILDIEIGHLEQDARKLTPKPPMEDDVAPSLFGKLFGPKRVANHMPPKSDALSAIEVKIAECKEKKAEYAAKHEQELSLYKQKIETPEAQKEKARILQHLHGELTALQQKKIEIQKTIQSTGRSQADEKILKQEMNIESQILAKEKEIFSTENGYTDTPIEMPSRKLSAEETAIKDLKMSIITRQDMINARIEKIQLYKRLMGEYTEKINNAQGEDLKQVQFGGETSSQKEKWEQQRDSSAALIQFAEKDILDYKDKNKKDSDKISELEAKLGRKP